MSKPQRRDLRFSRWQEIVAEIDRLEHQGYAQTGRWNLSQICEHLADWMTFPIDGFPKAPWFVRALLAILRVTQGKKLYAKFVAEQRMPTGQPTAPSTVHTAVDTQAVSVARLKRSIQRLVNHQGFLHPSPLFGQLDHEQIVNLQLAHAAHHLSFLLPK